MWDIGKADGHPGHTARWLPGCPAVRIAAALAVSAAALAASGVAAAATAVSSNWAGYAVTGTSYSTVSASWTQPAADCAVRTTSITASAFWVGLGGDATSSEALEQAGTEADCSATGAARYSAWYELVPAASVRLPLTLSPGDRISARVEVEGQTVRLEVADLTTGETASRTLTLASPDVSSAEWIAEAPATLTPMGAEVLPLTDFDRVAFSDARATSTGGHTGLISDADWAASRIALETSDGGPGSFGRFAAELNTLEAVPSALQSAGAAFSVSWQRTEASQSTPPGPEALSLRSPA